MSSLVEIDESNQPSEPYKINSFIEEDHAFVRQFLPPAAILTVASDCLNVVIIRTAYARVQLKFIYTMNYPNELPVIELVGKTLPSPLLRNKEKECLDKMKEHLGKSLFHIAYEAIYCFIHTNLFIPCWKEIKQVMTLCEGKGQLGADEKEGVLQMRLSCGNYKQSVKLKVPFNYPEDGVQIEFLSSNFPQEIQFMFKSQAEELVRKLEAGITIEQALGNSSLNNLKIPLNKSSNGESKQKLTSGSIKSLKHDVNVLKQISDLRAASSAHDSKKYFTQANADRRDARKDLRRLAKAENEFEKEEQKRLLEEEQIEMKRLLNLTASETAQPSLFHVAKYLVDEYVKKLPLEKCQACSNCVLADNPDSESNTNPRSEKRAMRTFCGHWLHWSCLNEWLTTPPFIRNCPACSRRIWHPDWPEDYKQLEKAWQSREARKREVNDVSDFMGMGSEFSK